MANEGPPWLTALNDEDVQFLKRFLLASGSLKALAKEYGISYPTVRARLDRLIAKVEAADDAGAADPFRRQLQILLADGMVGASAARALLTAHEEVLAKTKGGGHEEMD